MQETNHVLRLSDFIVSLRSLTVVLRDGEGQFSICLRQGSGVGLTSKNPIVVVLCGGVVGRCRKSEVVVGGREARRVRHFLRLEYDVFHLDLRLAGRREVI